MNNAVKFTDKGGVSVDVYVKENCVEIKVIDTGIGISKEYHQLIFEEFRQVSEGHSRNFEGSGLGLNITKKLVEKFGGEIYVESSLGQGSTFTVKLPFTIDGNYPIGEKVKISEKKYNVTFTDKLKQLALLVDDDPFMHSVLTRYLSDYYKIEATVNGEFAIKLCKEKKYDIVFMDINLKHGMDGKQVTRELRKLQGYENIPIVAITAYAMVGDREEFLAAGCSHYISKPFTQKNLLKLVDDIRQGK